MKSVNYHMKMTRKSNYQKKYSNTHQIKMQMTAKFNKTKS